MTELIVMLVLPLCHCIHEFMVHILSIYNQVMIDVEDEIPRIGEGLAHCSELVKISADCSFALLKLSSDIAND